MTSDVWPVVALGDLAEDVTVGHVGPMASEYVQSGVPFLRSQNVEPFRITLDDVKYINESFHARLAKSSLRPGDVVVVRTGRPGSAAVVPPELSPANCSDLVIIRPGPSLDSQYLMYFINSVGSHHVAAQLVGAVQQHFNVGSARTLPIPLPPLREQRRIARALGALDTKIELNRRMSRTLESMARAIFKSWFVDFDSLQAKDGGALPGLSGDLGALFPPQVRTTTIGACPEEWETKPLDGVAHFLNGLALQKYPPTGESDLPAIKGAELMRGVTATSSFASSDVPTKYVVRAGDVLFSWSGSLTCVVWTDVDGALNQHVFKVTSDTYPRWFVYFWVCEHLPEFRLIAADKATTMGHIKRSHLSNAEVVVPPCEVLARADRVIRPLVDRWLAAESEARQLARLRDALLPRLMSGSLEIPQVSALEERSRHAAG